MSIVVPVKDEADNLPILIDQIKSALTDYNEPWEVLFIDDGSTDGSDRVIAELQQTNPQIRCLQFERNYGKTAALDAGFKHARGEFLVIMDADCQNDPADLPNLLAALEDYDIVCGIREKRLDSKWRLVQSRIANRIRDKITGDGVRDSGCGYQAIRKKALANVKLYEGMHRFLPCLVQLEGGTFGQIPVRHHPRVHGQSKYPFWSRLKRAAVDLWAVRWMIQRRIQYSIKERL